MGQEKIDNAFFRLVDPLEAWPTPHLDGGFLPSSRELPPELDFTTTTDSDLPLGHIALRGDLPLRDQL